MHALIIINPAARRAPRRDALAEALREAHRAGWRTEIAVTGGPGEAPAIARRAADGGCAAVFACGGDGTLNEVANGLVGTDVALGCIPAGTMNIWAREHGLPSDPAAALRLLTEGATRAADVGWVEHASGARAFLLMAGVGYDGVVTRSVRAREKRLAGPLGFVRAALTNAFSYRAPVATLRHDGAVEQAHLGLLAASNTRIYAGVFRLAPEAQVDDGTLEVTLVDLERMLPHGVLALPRLLLGLVRRDGRRGRVRGFRTADLMVETDRPAPLQVDGEVVGETPVRLTIRPRALTVVVPAGPNRLYGSPPGPPLSRTIARV